MRLWRCTICGGLYLGEEKPKNCPFYGAHERYIVEQAEHKDPVIESLTAVSKKNPEAALQLEISNAEFYLCASRKASTDETKNLFNALSKVGSEHASVISKALKITKPEINTSDTCQADDMANLKESHMREERAVKNYWRVLSEAEEPRVQGIFSAIVAVESDHLSLSEERITD